MYSVIPAKRFEKDVKPLLKKYKSLRQELADMGELLANNPTIGTPLGKDCYKIRLAIKSKIKVKVVGRG
jgi:mRNA-degrading endonuclease RelE of RelBE toxin-antitoxin system